MEKNRLPVDYYIQDVLEVAPGLIGKRLMRRWPNGDISAHYITETEAYRGFEDKACHASKGKTNRTKVMFENGGIVYMYLIYGLHWMFNIVTSSKDIPQAVLIRGIRDINGPGRLSKKLQLNKSFNGENLITSDRIWIEPSPGKTRYTEHPRIGIDYAGSPWIEKAWRYVEV
jgi:DNA-3-methyladenine glycosylase